jgi:hypothetical protein
MVLYTFSQNLQVIAPFQYCYQSASSGFLGKVQDQLRHVSVTVPAEVHMGQGVLNVGIKARGNEH